MMEKKYCRFLSLSWLLSERLNEIVLHYLGWDRALQIACGLLS